MKSQISDDPDDFALLAIARELCVLLGLGESSVDRVLWSDFLNYARASVMNIPLNVSKGGPGPLKGPTLSPHYPILIRNALVLREMMKGRLAPEEWRPLICTSLIFYKQLNGKSKRKRRSALLPLQAFLVLVVLDIVFRLLNYVLIPLQYFFITYIVGFSIAMGLVVLLGRGIDRQLALEADLKTAMILGKEPLAKALEKVEAIRQSDLAHGRLNEWRGPDTVPSPTARIKNIQAVPDSANR